MKTIQQRWEQHKRDGGKLTLDQFTNRAKRRTTPDLLHGIDKATRKEIAMDAFGDMPDGAFFAAAESEFGLTVDDWCDE